MALPRVLEQLEMMAPAPAPVSADSHTQEQVPSSRSAPCDLGGPDGQSRRRNIYPAHHHCHCRACRTRPCAQCRLLPRPHACWLFCLLWPVVLLLGRRSSLLCCCL